MTEQLTEWDIELGERLAGGGNKRAGMLVETKTGLTGRTYSSEELVGGKVRVYTTTGAKMLCDPKTLKLKGFID